MKIQDERELIEHYVDLDTARYSGGRADARLRDSGVAVWAIIAYLPIYDGDIDRVADHFSISATEVEAALAYYRHNKKYVDARIALLEA